jgi:hypothetical protein
MFDFVGLGDAINHAGDDGREVLPTALHVREAVSAAQARRKLGARRLAVPHHIREIFACCPQAVSEEEIQTEQSFQTLSEPFLSSNTQRLMPQIIWRL